MVRLTCESIFSADSAGVVRGCFEPGLPIYQHLAIAHWIGVEIPVATMGRVEVRFCDALGGREPYAIPFNGPLSNGPFNS